MSDIPIKNIYDLSVYDLPLTTYDYVVGTHGNNEAVRIPASNLTTTKEISFSDVPSTPTSTGSTGSVACDADYIYTYQNGFWGRTPRDTSWNVEYFRIDDSATITSAQKTKIYSQLNLGEATTSHAGLVTYADYTTTSYQDAHTVTTPYYVTNYVAHHPAFELTNSYTATDTSKAVSGKAVKEALDGLNIPELTSTYSPLDETKAVTGKAVKSAIASGSYELTTSYLPNDSTKATTGMAIKNAITSLNIPSLTNLYNSEETTKAVTGKGVAAAIATVTMPTVVSTYSPTGTDPVNGKAVKQAIDTIEHTNLISDYRPNDTSNAISGKGVAAALATITFPTVDQTYNQYSTNAVSSAALAPEFASITASIPIAATTISAEDTEKFINGKLLSQALAGYTPSVSQTYDPTSVAGISGKGVSQAISNTWDPDDEIHAITAHAANTAITSISYSIPTIAKTYSTGQDTNYATCKTIDQAISTYRAIGYNSSDSIKLATGATIKQAFSNETKNTYTSTSTSPISGKGVAAALASTITSTYNATDTSQATTGKAVASAIAEYKTTVDSQIAYVHASVPTKAVEYNSADDSNYLTCAIAHPTIASLKVNHASNYAEALADNTKYVTGNIVAEAISALTPGGGTPGEFSLVDYCGPDEHDNAVTGYAVIQAITARVPAKATYPTDYTTRDNTKYVTCSVVHSAIKAHVPAKAIYAVDYESKDDTKFVTCLTVHQALTGNITSTYTPTNHHSAVNGAAVKAALDGLSIPEPAYSFDEAKTYNTVYATGSQISYAITASAASTIEYLKGEIPDRATTYLPNDETKYVTGKVVSDALASITPVEGGGSGEFSLVNFCAADNETSAVTGKAVMDAITLAVGDLTIPTVATYSTDYTSKDNTKYVTCLTVHQALTGNITSTYSATDTSKAITGKGVKSALDTLKADSFDSSNNTNFVTGQQVSEAISTLSTKNIWANITGANEDGQRLVMERNACYRKKPNGDTYPEISIVIDTSRARDQEPTTCYFYLANTDKFSVKFYEYRAATETEEETYTELTDVTMEWLYGIDPTNSSSALGSGNTSQTHVIQLQQIGKKAVLGAYLYSYTTPAK